MDPELQSTRDYIRETAAKADSIEDLVALVEREVLRLHAAAAAFDEAVLAHPLDGDWTPLVCLSHAVSRTMHRAREVLYVALSGELPPEEEIHVAETRDGLIAQHRAAMDSLYAHVRDATDDFLAVEWSHPAFGAMNWKQWLVFIQVHSEAHASQLEAMLQAAARAR